MNTLTKLERQSFQSGKVPLSAIVVGDRKRSLGDITSLVNSIKELGLINPISILPDGTLVAGYHRLEACKSIGWQEIDVIVVPLDELHAELAEIDENLVRNELHFLDRDDWMKRRKEIYETLYPETKKGTAQALSMNKSLGNNVNEIISPTFTEDASTKTGQSKRNVELSIQRAKAFTPEQREILKQVDISQTKATELARLEEPKRELVIQSLASGKSFEDAQREIRREQAREHIEQLKNQGVELPPGKYSCIVIDPPWPVKWIDRSVRPNQIALDYPTMTEQELKDFDLSALASDNCHLYLWTTQKYLPMALMLAEHWGFKYQCQMTWVKNIGFTPFSWMYSTEHILFCTKGNLPLLKLGKRLDFKADVREHSRKPDEFYDLVREVSPGPRIDIFSREQREGFSQYGNEVEKYASDLKMTS